MRPHVDGTNHSGLAESVSWISYSLLMPVAQGMPMRQDKTLALAEHYRPVPNSWGSQNAFSASQHENFKILCPPDDLPLWWHSWGLPSKTHERGTQDTPTLEEEAELLGKEIKPPPVPGSPQEWLEMPRFVEPAKWNTAPSPHPPLPHPNLVAFLLGKPRNLSKGWKLTLTVQACGSAFTYRSMIECQNGVENFNLFFTQRMNMWALSRPKGWLNSSPLSSGCQPCKLRKMACGLPNPASGFWDAGITSPQRMTRAPMIIKWCSAKK